MFRKIAKSSNQGDMSMGSDKSVKVLKPRLEKFHIFVIAMDVGRNSAKNIGIQEDMTDFEQSKQIIDWIFSRKATTNSKIPNVYVHDEEPKNASVEHLQVLYNEAAAPNVKFGGDYVSALLSALGLLKVYKNGLEDAKYCIGSTILLVSNLTGLDIIDDIKIEEKRNLIANGFLELNSDLILVGVDFVITTENPSQHFGVEFIKSLMRLGVSTEAYGFTESLSRLQLFVPKYTAPRAQPFKFEIGADSYIELQMFVKNSERKIELKFKPVNTQDTDSSASESFGSKRTSYEPLEKVRRFELADGQPATILVHDIDSMPDRFYSSDAPADAVDIPKDTLIKAYRYGLTDVPLSQDLESLVAYPDDSFGKQLQLLQFVKRENILPQFVTSPCRYFVAKFGDHSASTATSALVQAMIEQGVVAICRYAYNRIAKPNLACLIPKISKFHFPILIHYQMPFADDFRYYDFPPIETSVNDSDDTEPDDYHLDVIDSFINSMLLCIPMSKDATPNASKTTFELLSKRRVNNPKLQYQCQLLKQKAMDPERSLCASPSCALSDKQRSRLLIQVSPPHKLVYCAGFKQAVENLRATFPLVRQNVKLAAFRLPGESDKRGMSLSDSDDSAIDTDMWYQVDDNLEIIAKKINNIELEGTNKQGELC